MQALYGRPVFAVDGNTFFWEDVVLDAVRRGKWNRLEQEVREGFAAMEEVDSTAGDAGFEAAVEEAAQEFRYARDLVTAKEMEDWLAAREIGILEWMQYIRRGVARSRTSARLGALVGRYLVEPTELDAAMRVDLICSGAGEELATDLAERVAAAVALGGPVEVESGGTAVLSQLPPGLSRETARERLELLIQIDAGAEAFRNASLTRDAVHREISHHHTEWIRIDCRAIAFGDEAGAREAALCLREDGLALDDVADAAHAIVAESRFYLDDLEPELRPVFLAARPIDLLGPILFEGSYTLFRVIDKVMPSEQDPEILLRAEAGVAARALAEQARLRVEWQLPW